MNKYLKASRSKVSNYCRSYNFLGVVVGLIFLYLGFLPTLLPRGWILQGVLSGILFATGYAIGLTASHFYRQFGLKEPKLKRKRQVKKYFYIAAFYIYFAVVIIGFNLQQEVRKLVDETPASSISIVGTTVVTILVVIFIMLVARSIRRLYRFLKRLINKYIPHPIAYVSAWIITAFLVIGVVNGVILSNVVEGLNEAFGVKNGTTDKGITQPKDSHLSGSEQSLIKWDTLGRQGRNFIGRATPAKKLSEFNKTTSTQPIRIYSGLDSADNTKDRADLATADLKRAGGFDRKIIVVVTTTGTGWVDEQGVVPIEYMYNGDSAIVAMQYSFLPSWLSFLVDQQKAKDAGSQLYNAVYNESLKIPEEERPKIVVFGESLGSYGGEAAFANEASFRSTSDGAVWAGPPNFNILRKTATENRDKNSSEILPVYKNGEILRFAAKPNDLNQPEEPWSSPKAVYLENPSDPIVWWSPHLLFNKPDWLKESRGADVHKSTYWLPIITFWGVSGDMVFSTGVPDGHGHKYGTLPTDAWSYVAPSDSWNQQKTEALKAELSK